MSGGGVSGRVGAGRRRSWDGAGGGCRAARERAAGAAVARVSVWLGAARRPSVRPAGRALRPAAQMAVRGANTLTPFSIQAILNRKEERGGLAAPEGRPAPGGTAGTAAPAPAACCWRLFGETDAGALGGAEDSLLASPAQTRTAAGQSAGSPGGWDSDSALSEENEGRRRCADAPGASGAGRAGGLLSQPVCELHAAKDLEEEVAGRSDSEMSASVSGTPRRGLGGGVWTRRAPRRAGRASCEHPARGSRALAVSGEEEPSRREDRRAAPGPSPQEAPGPGWDRTVAGGLELAASAWICPHPPKSTEASSDLRQ